MTDPAAIVDTLPYPTLAEPYATALREATAFIVERYDPVGLIVGGSVLRGQGGPSSDLDLYVIHRHDWRQRVQQWFNGVPAEIFVNPRAAIEDYFEEEHHSARPITAHILSTGHVLINRDPVVDELRALAREKLARTPTLSEADLTFMRYLAAAQFEDALDVIDTDPATADLIMSQAILAALRYAFRQASRYLPRDKDLIAAARDLDPVLGKCAAAYFAAPVAERRAWGEQIVDHVLHTRGFFAWESEPDPVPPREL